MENAWCRAFHVSLITGSGFQGATLTLHPFTCQHLDPILLMLQTLISKLVTFLASWGPQIPIHNQETLVDSHSWSRPSVTYLSTEVALRCFSVEPLWPHYGPSTPISDSPHAVILRTHPHHRRGYHFIHPLREIRLCIMVYFGWEERESQQWQGPFPLSWRDHLEGWIPKAPLGHAFPWALRASQFSLTTT